MKPQQTIDIAKDFSPEPIGRYLTDSDRSGEVFREKILVPALNAAELVQIILDGTEGYGSSFLEEAFGGLIRNHPYSAKELLARLSFVTDEDPSLEEEIVGYMKDADAAKSS